MDKIKMDDKEHEEVKRELSALMELTLHLEDELNLLVSKYKT